MTILRRSIGLFLFILCSVTSTSTLASNLSFTFLDFQYVLNTLDTTGTQTNEAIGQTVDVSASEGNGIGIAGDMRIGNRFYLGGSFHSSIIDVDGIVSNENIGSQAAKDEFDFIQTNLHFGYIHEVGENLDLTVEITHDSTEFDFGSFAGENFDTDDSGAGLRVGARWNPTPRLELSAFAHQTPVGKVNLSNLTFDSDTIAGVGIRWYALEDLGFSVDFTSGEYESVMISMRFSFGNLSW